MSLPRIEPGSPLTGEALQASHRIIQAHSKSFSLASRLLPPRVRDRAVVVYAWCRRADDAVDLATLAQGQQAVERLRRELDGIYGESRLEDPILEAFRQVTKQCHIPRLYPEELLTGLEMDLTVFSYDCMPRLLLYSYRVAGVVGLMMCHVMGLHDEGATRNAVHLGVAMQLTNICRDVAEDWHRGRLYVPADLLQRHGYRGLGARLGRPFPKDARWPVARAVAELLEWADTYYRSGDAGLHALGWRSDFAVRTARKVYSAIGTRLRLRHCDPLAGRVWVGQGAKLRLLTSAWVETTHQRLRGGRPFRVEELPPPRGEVRAEEVLPVRDMRPLREMGPHV